jgi:uncharacterized FlaG/YvyC family protein
MDIPKVAGQSFPRVPQNQTRKSSDTRSDGMQQSAPAPARSIRIIYDKELTRSVVQVFEGGTMMTQIPSEETIDFSRNFDAALTVLKDKYV